MKQITTGSEICSYSTKLSLLCESHMDITNWWWVDLDLRGIKT